MRHLLLLVALWLVIALLVAAPAYASAADEAMRTANDATTYVDTQVGYISNWLGCVAGDVNHC